MNIIMASDNYKRVALIKDSGRKSVSPPASPTAIAAKKSSSLVPPEVVEILIEKPSTSEVQATTKMMNHHHPYDDPMGIKEDENDEDLGKNYGKKSGGSGVLRTLESRPDPLYILCLV